MLGEYMIPKGASVVVRPYITQRNPRYFLEPEAFQPELWQAATVPKFAYFPFGVELKHVSANPLREWRDHQFGSNRAKSGG